MIHTKLDNYFNFQTNTLTLTIIRVTVTGKNSSYVYASFIQNF